MKNLNSVLKEKIRDAIVAANSDKSVRAIVMTGAGNKVFCAGADLKAEGSGSPVKPDMAAQHNPLTELFRTFEACNIPIIARVNGHVLAGGMGLLCGCDLAITVDTAKFGVPNCRKCRQSP